MWWNSATERSHTSPSKPSQFNQLAIGKGSAYFRAGGTYEDQGVRDPAARRNIVVRENACFHRDRDWRLFPVWVLLCTATGLLCAGTTRVLRAAGISLLRSEFDLDFRLLLPGWS